MNDDRLQDVFDRVRRLEGDERQRYLDDTCGNDLELRREVEALLAYANDFPDEPAPLNVKACLQPEGEDAPTPEWDRAADQEGAIPEEGPSETDDIPERIDKYRVKRRLGKGGYGNVYLAYDDDAQRLVAIKVPHSDRIKTPKDVDAYLDEARTVVSLKHPNIVPVHEVRRTDDGLCYVVSEFIEGGNLATRIKESRSSHVESAELVATVADALKYTHGRELVHRDIKPANILLDAEGKPYLTDFGIALKEEDFGKRSGMAGTLQYMSPEQARGESHRVNGRSDIFSLGVVFYELLTGRRPFRAESPLELIEQITTVEPSPLRQRDHTIPKELERICLKALSKRLSDRYTTAFDMAEDLRHWASENETKTTEAISPGITDSITADQPVRVVPKGLRPFDKNDADFFLQLLPGPIDRDGLPETIRFWKTLIEALDPDETFRVGVLYGPSGCGKSSLMRAGLLPVLGDHIVSVYVEATPEETEIRLLKRLHKIFPVLANSRNLVDCLSKLRCGRGIPWDTKVLVVLDQFEQWLHARHDYAETELVQALRHCDGARVECIVTVRDDFWMAVTRFMRELEVPLVECENSAAVHLFEMPHARHVLAEFGRAYGRLPANLADLTEKQSQFLDDAVEELAEEGRINPVRLSLVAEMVKGKPWAPGTLKHVGGEKGIRRKFLEETFSAAHAPPEHRLYQKAIRQVLSSLLPEEGSDLKGSLRSRQQLLRASGYVNRERDFDAVLRILNDLRLITPTDPEEVSYDESDSQIQAATGEKYYQLTHDYLVPSLREWLNGIQLKTRRGRAELLLEERAKQWSRSRQDRLLPSVSESLKIALYTRRAGQTECRREMLRRAFMVHGRRLTLSAILVAGLAFALWMLIPKPPSQFELLQGFADPAASTQARIAAFDRLRVDDARIFLGVVQTLETVDNPDVFRRALPRLSELADQADTQGAVRALLNELLEAILVRHFDDILPGQEHDDIQMEAFSHYSRLAPRLKVLEQIELHASQAGQKTIRAMARYLENQVLTELSNEARSEVIRTLSALIKDDPGHTLVDACVAKLDEVYPAQLLAWLVKAHESPEVEKGARDSLMPYASKTAPERRRTMGRCVESRLVELVKQSEQGTATATEQTFELEFLVHALKELQPLGTIRYDDGLNTLAYVLQQYVLKKHPDLPLYWDEMAVAVIKTFAVLNRDKRNLQLLRDILDDVDGNEDVLEAAVVALGDLHDLQSVGLLKELATNNEAEHKLRFAAVKSLRKVGLFLQREKPTSPKIHDIVKTLGGLLEECQEGREEAPKRVVLEALTAYGDLADPSDVDVLFRWLIKPDYEITATYAVHSILIRRPDGAYEVVQRYVGWRPTVDSNRQELRQDPDLALVGFQLFLDSTGRTSAERAAKSAVKALARAKAEVPDKSGRDYAAYLLDRAQRHMKYLDAAIAPAQHDQKRASQLEK